MVVRGAMGAESVIVGDAVGDWTATEVGFDADGSPTMRRSTMMPRMSPAASAALQRQAAACERRAASGVIEIVVGAPGAGAIPSPGSAAATRAARRAAAI